MTGMARDHSEGVVQKTNITCLCTCPVYMNVTLSIDERLVAEARRLAAIPGTTLNQLIRGYLVTLTQTEDMQTVVSQLEALWASGNYLSDADWTRDELHERP